MTSRLANMHVDTTSNKAVQLKEAELIPMLITIPKNPTNVAHVRCKPTRSFRKIEEKIRTKSGVVKLSVVPNVKGREVKP